MHCLVTGGAGFIGSHVCRRLLAQGASVTAVDNFDPFYDVSIKRANVSDLLAKPGYRLIEHDVRDIGALAGSLSPVDVMIHLAAKAGVRPSLAEPGAYASVNVGGTLQMLELARLLQTRQFVFASSSSVYGVNPRVPWREDDNVLLPISPYASTKTAGELMGYTYSHLYDIRFVALRFFTVYGPGQRPDLAIHKFARAMLDGKPMTIFGDGSSRRDYTFIDDIVEGVVAAAQYTAARYEIFNLGNSRTVSLRQLVPALEVALSCKARLTSAPMQPGDVPVTSADISKARRLLGYSPCTPIETGLTRFAEWLLHRGTAGVGRERPAPLPEEAGECVGIER